VNLKKPCRTSTPAVFINCRTPPFKPDNKWLEEKRDEHDRIIINNKYRILDNIYQENFKI
jgi:hypothetical protein